VSDRRSFAMLAAALLTGYGLGLLTGLWVR
jgi:hypothetical protein